MSICFVHAWCSGWCAIEIAAWLSEKIVEVEGEGIPTSLSKDLCQMTCLAQCVAAMYSALAVDSATIDCFLELHATVPPDSVITYPLMDFLPASDAQSASQ